MSLVGEIRVRDAKWWPNGGASNASRAAHDRRALLAEIDRLEEIARRAGDLLFYLKNYSSIDPDKPAIRRLQAALGETP